MVSGTPMLEWKTYYIQGEEGRYSGYIYPSDDISVYS